jgi:hypothetical protein
MKSLEEEAVKWADDNVEYTGGFIAGANSKWVQAEKIRAKIEAVNHFCKLNGFAGTNSHKAVILMYEQQLKQLEDESKIN